MDSILNSFHVELGLFVAQIINFAIVFAVLFYFVIKPLMKVMKERSEKIEESLRHADQVAKKLTETEADYDRKIAEARIEAARIIDEATEKAIAKKEAIVAKSKEEIGVIINKEKESIRAQKEKTMKEIKSELTDIVMQALEKVLEKKIDQKEDRELIKKTLNK